MERNSTKQENAKSVKIKFDWKVEIAGSWANWKPISCQRSRFGWVANLRLSPGVYEYKYIVNGVWYVDPTRPKVSNGLGTYNNIFEVKNCQTSWSSTRVEVLAHVTLYLNMKLPKMLDWPEETDDWVVKVAGNWSDKWEVTMCQKSDCGSWNVELGLLPGTYKYKFLINGVWYADLSRPHLHNPFGTLDNILHIEDDQDDDHEDDTSSNSQCEIYIPDYALQPA